MLDDLIKMSSTDRSFGNFLISDISYLEHFIDLGISLIMVFDFTKLLSNAIANVKVLKIDPSSYTPLVILFMYFSSLTFAR